MRCYHSGIPSLTWWQDRKEVKESDMQQYGAMNETVATLWSTHADTYPEDVYAGGTALP